jgi:integral membrane sensor domain MASE1
VATVLARAILDPESRRRTILGATEIGLITILYFALAKASLAFASINPSATPVWPPTGLALGLALVRGYRVVPAIFVGAFTVNLTIAWSPATSFSIATGNSLEAFLGAFILNKWLAGPSAFESPLGIAKFALVVAEWPLQLVPPSVSCRWPQLVSLNRVPFRQFGQPGGLAIWLAR